MLSVDVLNPRI